MNDRELLRRLLASPVSGDELAAEIGMTRAAVWKRIRRLRTAGIAIEGRAGTGYRLTQPVELLDVERIADTLPDTIRTDIAALEVAWTLESTNAELLRRTPPERGTALLLAERQTQGRGRRGRHWVSPLAAHIYISALRRFSDGLAKLGGLSLVAGVAAAEALHTLGYDEVGLKWPNDLYVGKQKLGGLLVEGRGEYAGPSHAVIGIGINVHMPSTAASHIDQAWTDLTALRAERPSRNAVASVLIAHLVPALAQFDNAGLASFLSRYASLDILCGQAITVATPHATINGIAAGIAPDGALIVKTPAGESQFHAGEVSVRAS